MLSRCARFPSPAQRGVLRLGDGIKNPGGMVLRIRKSATTGGSDGVGRSILSNRSILNFRSFRSNLSGWVGRGFVTELS